MGPLERLLLAPWYVRLAAVAAFMLASSLWLRAASRRAAGCQPWRLAAAAAPLLVANAAVPLLFPRDTEGVSVAFSAFIVTWLASFKAVALALGRGPLVQQPWGPLQFFALYSLPIIPKPSAAPSCASAAGAPLLRRASSRQLEQGPGTSRHLLLRWLLKAGVTAAVVFTVAREGLPPFARTCLYTLGIYSMLGVVMDGPAALVLRPLRLDLAPHFLPPWECASLTAFWGSHWNQAASNALRTAIFEPIVEGRLVNRPRLAALAAAIAGTAGTAATVIVDAAGAAASNGPGPSGGPRGPDQQARHLRPRRSARLAEAEALAEAETEAKAKAEGELAAAGSGGGGVDRGGMGGIGVARLAGMAASFLASGLVHELIFLFVQGSFTRRLAWLCFFTGQLPLILAERWLLSQLKASGVVVPQLARRALTLGVLLGISHWLFFRPAELAGVPALFAASMRHSFAELAHVPGELARSFG